jgi:hypothetical protein
MVDRHEGVNLTFDRESVAWTDAFIERLRPAIDETMIRDLSVTMGAFLGECIRTSYGGEWRRNEDGDWGIYFDDSNAIFPFAKVQKQFQNGSEDSILSFYEIISLVFFKIERSKTTIRIAGPANPNHK